MNIQYRLNHLCLVVFIVLFHFFYVFLNPLVAVLTVDHSVVDLETIEALYENVCMMAHVCYIL